MVLRSDEQANEAEIERDKRFRGNVSKGIATAASLGTAAIASPLASKIMPFLNEYIPSALAMKGINKISPKLGSFLKNGQEMGLNVEDGLNFIKDKLSSEGSKEEPKEHRNIISQYSPELHQFLKGEISKGRGVLEAGADAERNKNFKNIISMIKKDHKSPWSAILKTVYGEGLTKEQAVKEFNKHKEKKSLVEQETERFEKGYGKQQQPGQGQAALMAILQKIQQARGGQ